MSSYSKRLENMKETNIETRIEVAIEQIRQLRTDVTEIKQKLDSNYVTKEEFSPVRQIVYGIVSLILLGVVGAVLALVVHQ